MTKFTSCHRIPAVDFEFMRCVNIIKLPKCNVGNGEDGFEPARRTDGLSAIQ